MRIWSFFGDHSTINCIVRIFGFSHQRCSVRPSWRKLNRGFHKRGNPGRILSQRSRVWQMGLWSTKKAIEDGWSEYFGTISLGDWALFAIWRRLGKGTLRKDRELSSTWWVETHPIMCFFVDFRQEDGQWLNYWKQYWEDERICRLTNRWYR